MTGLAWRWIGFHILAFGLHSLAASCIGSMESVYGDAGTSASSLTGNVLAYAVLPILVATAQVLALAGNGFPIRPILWFLVTIVGISLGFRVSEDVIGPAFHLIARPLIKSTAHLMSAAMYSVWAVVFVTQGAVLALAQGVPLLFRVTRPLSMLWAVSVLGAWSIAQGVDYLVGQVTISVEARLDPSVTLGEAIACLAGAASCGASFAALLLPALRRLLAHRPLAA